MVSFEEPITLSVEKSLEIALSYEPLVTFKKLHEAVRDRRIFTDNLTIY